MVQCCSSACNQDGSRPAFAMCRRPPGVCRSLQLHSRRLSCLPRTGAHGTSRARAQLVRRWRLGSLAPARAGALHCHHHSVRTLAAGPCETLVSGDAAGGLALWTV